MAANPNRVELFSPDQTWYHGHTIHFIMILIITGMPLLFESSYWMAYLIGVPFAYVQGMTNDEQVLYIGIQACRIIHRSAALLWILVSVPFMFRILPKIHRWHIVPRRAKGETWGEYIKNGVTDLKLVYIDWKYPKHTGKYNIAQMASAWAVITACLMMVISGGLLIIKSRISLETMELARLMHDIGFCIIALFLIVHIYFAVHPINRAAYRAMFGDGSADKDDVKKKHPRFTKN